MGLHVRLSLLRDKNKVWSSPLAMPLLKLRTAGFLNLKIQQANAISVWNWCFIIEVIGFNFKDNFIIAREPLVCGNIFYNCPIVPIAQIA